MFRCHRIISELKCFSPGEVATLARYLQLHNLDPVCDRFVICDVRDSQQLQLNLDYIASWSRLWLLNFNGRKCQVMQVGNSPDTLCEKDGTRTVISHVTSARDLGVWVAPQIIFHYSAKRHQLRQHRHLE